MSFLAANSSGSLTANTVVCSGPCYLAGFDFMPPATGNATVIIYDSENTDTTGKKILAEAQVDAGTLSLNHNYTIPIIANRGIYVVFSGSTATFILSFVAA